jgi:hypothetical protein
VRLPQESAASALVACQQRAERIHARRPSAAPDSASCTQSTGKAATCGCAWRRKQESPGARCAAMASADGKRALPQEANGGHQQLTLKKQRREDGSALAVSAKRVEPEVRGARPCTARRPAQGRAGWAKPCAARRPLASSKLGTRRSVSVSPGPRMPCGARHGWPVSAVVAPCAAALVARRHPTRS